VFEFSDVTRNTRQGPIGSEGSKNPILQQIMDTMRALQEANEEAKVDQLRPYDGYLVGFVGDQVEVRGYVELKTTFTDKNATKAIIIRYIVVILNRLGAIASTTRMRMRLPLEEGGVITIKVDQKATRKGYESSMKDRRKTYAIV